MTWTKLPAAYSAPVVVLGVVVCTALLAEAWLGYRATQEWQASSTLLVERRARENIDLLTTALSRDMRGVQATVLSSRDWNARSFARPYEARAVIAGAFARYPYPESFFGWSALGGPTPVIFIRANQPPPWLSSPIPAERYPVEIVDEPTLGRRILSALEGDVRAGRRHSVLELDIGAERYQIVTQLNFVDDAPERLESAFGFMVNLRRAREEYFAGILQQVARLTDAAHGLEYSLIDDQGVFVVGGGPDGQGEVLLRRTLPILFLDPRQVTLPPAMAASARVWTVQVRASRDDTLAIAAQGARRTRIVIASAAAAAALGLFMAIRVARASIDFANMRSDFVSSVTHELKTPLSTIRGVSETLARGRLASPDALPRYAQLLMQESRRLIRLVDNLLAYARVTDVTEVYTFQPLEPAELVAAAMQGFPNLREASVEIDVPASLPTVRVDRTSMVLALDNLIDNAVRYSGDTPRIAIRATEFAHAVELAIEDRGEGIPPADLPLITKRFVRGRTTKVPGSGLGLAIVTRVIADHGGQMAIQSTPGLGTTVRLTLPVSGA